MNRPLNGVYTASLTPLTASFEPNIPALVRHAQWLLESGSDGVALLGSTGEANSLTLEQRLSIIEQTARELPPDRLMLGTGSCALQDSVRLTKASVDAGVFSVLVIPPFYYKPQSDESVLRFYSELISSVDEPRLRIIFYNFPKLSGYNFSVKILQELKQRFGDIAAGIKDSSGEWKNMLGIVQNIPDFMVYTGTETLLLDILKKGGAGCITATANLIAPECQRVYQAWRNNKQKVAEQAQINLTDLRKTLENYPLVSELKSLFASKTNAEEWENMLPPFAPILDKQVEELTEQIKGLGLDLSQRL
jgi:4-hydroxy-tetrahydrodipicolinate synthase